MPRTTTLPVDLTKIVEHADSFTVLVQGNALGFQTNALTKTASGFSLHTAVQIGPVLQQTVATTFSSDLAPQAVTLKGKVQGNEMHVDVAYAAGRVKGTSTTPGPGGMKSITIDTIIAPGVLDDNMITALVPGLRWTPNAKFNVNSFDAGSGALKPLTLAVTASEFVTVPAGSFQVYRVDLTGQEQPLTMFITTTAPHRIVKMMLVGTPIEFLLVK